jgi:hypothetical protein
MFDPQVFTDQLGKVTLMLREAEKVFSTGAAIFGGSATGAGISAALTVHLHGWDYERMQQTTHNAFGGTPLTADQAAVFTLCAMIVLSLLAILARDLISAFGARRRPARTPLQQ